MVKLIPTLLTFSSLLSASTALIALVMAPSSPARDVLIGACIAWSMVADGLDGPLARTLDAQTNLGAHLDSLCDLTAFGIAPALWLVGRHGVDLGAIVVVPAVLWIGAAAFRLARFADDGVKKVGRFGPAFTGVPTPVAAALLVTSVAVATLLGERLVEVGALVVGALLMPSHVAYPKAGIGRWPWVVAVPVAVAVLARHAFS
jgi:CDP-diacylglycerol--serine O-phosphatidyltransferase